MGAFFIYICFIKSSDMPTLYKILIFIGNLLIPLLVLWLSDLSGLVDVIKWSPLPEAMILLYSHTYLACFIIAGILQALSMFYILKNTSLLLKIIFTLCIAAIYYYLTTHFWIESLHPENPYSAVIKINQLSIFS